MDYEQFFGLSDTPFRLTPDPDYYFPSDVHKEALQTLIYSIRAREGFIQITGNPGTGKTLTLRTLLKQLGDEVTTALILNPRLSPSELLKVILEDLGLSPLKMEEKPKEELLRFFREILLEKAQSGTNTVLIIDEAQNLPNDTLEELRLLSNLETEKKKLLQIILVGQLELEEKLKQEDLKQLDQRITIRYRLKPLSREDTEAYIRHRLRVAGGGDAERFPPRVLNQVYKASGGVPRLINIICERALMAAFVDGKSVIERPHFKKAIESIVGEKVKRTRPKASSQSFQGRTAVILLALLLVVALVGVGWQFFRGGLTSRPSAPPEARTGIMKGLVAEAGTNQTQDFVPGQGPVSAAEEKKRALMPLPPPQVVYVPPGAYFLSLDREKGKAFLWEGSDPAPVLKGEFVWDKPLPDGLFVIGNNINNKQFLFNYPLFFWGSNHLASGTVWPEIAKLVPSGVVPLVSYSSARPTSTANVKQARQIRSIIQDWAEAWREKDLERLLGFYAKTFTSCYNQNEKPTVFAKENLRRIKNDVFMRSGSIVLTISEPVCLLDPGNPDMVMALFYQKYESEVYGDEGLKALYFSLVEGEDGKPAWMIVAKLWIPVSESRSAE
ncbi:MAG: AAA family ATPase [Proteobacteria bacterium]|nr:AAA family ATPase [Pseudomonadota bacterium]